jgi:hypothetical protein
MVPSDLATIAIEHFRKVVTKRTHLRWARQLLAWVQMIQWSFPRNLWAHRMKVQAWQPHSTVTIIMAITIATRPSVGIPLTVAVYMKTSLLIHNPKPPTENRVTRHLHQQLTLQLSLMAVASKRTLSQG